MVLGALAASQAAAFPVLGTGEIHFRLDHAAFRSAEGTPESEFYIELDTSEVEFQPKDGRLRANLRLYLAFFADGDGIDEKTYPLEVWGEGDAAHLPRTQVVQLRVSSPADADSVYARLEDQSARKRGLLHLFTQSRRSGKAGARLSVRKFPAATLSVSDLECARFIGSAEAGSAFVKSGMEIEPNPGRVYGAPDPTLCTYLEVYDLSRGPEETRRRYGLEYRLRNPQGESIRTWEHALASQEPTWADTTCFTVAGLVSGSYSLGVVIRGEGEERAAVETSFDVLWASPNWVAWTIQAEQVAPFLFQSFDLDDFLALSPGSRERRLEEFWARHDPTPGPGNATREEFDRRVAYSNENFSTPVEPGMRTDRGRTYIKFGEPDELRREVIPVQGNDLNAAMEELDRETSGELKGSRDIDSEDSRSFEVWIYNYLGEELFPSDQMSTNLGRQLIFVDDLGVGDYRLIRSSEKNEF
jgi:GWxTD domain-containing protein